MKYNNLDLGTIEAVFNKLGGLEEAQRFLRGELVVKAAELLRKVTEVAVSDAKRFVAKDHLVGANVFYIGTDFKEFFLEKIEKDVEGINLNVHHLKKASLDASILAELGDRAQTSLAHLFELLTRQSKGELGPLLTNGHTNIAYIVGSDGNLWAVTTHWLSGGWRVYAYSVRSPDEWLASSRVLSR